MAGTDIAMESADIILVGDQLHLLLTAYHISSTSYRRDPDWGEGVRSLAHALRAVVVGVRTTHR